MKPDANTPPENDGGRSFVIGFVIGLVAGSVGALVRSTDTKRAVWRVLRRNQSAHAGDDAFIEGLAEGRAAALSRQQNLSRN